MNTNSGVVALSTSFSDIPAISTTLWFSGCNLQCHGCHNTTLKEFADGMSMHQIKHELSRRKKLTNWLVYLGGNPLDRIDVVMYISQFAHTIGYKQFLYTGYTFQQYSNMFDSSTHKTILNYFDFIKTGGYNHSLSKSCRDDARDYFFATLNQEVYKSNKKFWEKIYGYDFSLNKIIGEFIIGDNDADNLAIH